MESCMISTDLQVALKILEYNQCNEPIWFSKLADEFHPLIGIHKVSTAWDKLYMRGMCEGSWEKIDGFWTYTLHISEDIIPFLKGIQNKLNTHNESVQTNYSINLGEKHDQ